MTEGVQKAIIFTLSVHAVALFTLTLFTVSDTTPASEQYAEIEFLDAAALEELLEASIPQSDPSLLSEKLQERIANIRADASALTSSESRSTGLTAAEQSAIDRAVASELAALESAELDRLAAQEKEFDTVGLPEDSNSDRVDTMDDWDKQFEGRVTVRFDLTDRSPRNLDVPGYQCRGRADVVVSITVNSDGVVVSAELISGVEPGSCFALAALRSAEASRFIPSTSAPRSQSGTLTYAFVAQ
jgi:hypothetical protein